MIFLPALSSVSLFLISSSMMSALTGHGVDLEAQHGVPHLSDVGGSDAHEINIRPSQSETKGYPHLPPLASTDQDIDPEAQSVIPRDGGEGSEIHEKNVNKSENDDGTGHTPERIGLDEVQVEAESLAEPEVDPRIRVIIDAPVDSCPPDGSSDPGLEAKRLIGDFDGSANAFWALYGKEAKSHDEAQIQTLKDDMDGVLIFAGLFSAVLTAFIIDGKQDLKVNPADQMVHYLQQNVAILDQISHQISAIAPQVSIPSRPPPPFPAFKPLASDIRMNVFWFMALIFSLSAALLATLVQKWVRNYMHASQRYSDSLKRARLRQYLHEGSEGWYMPVVAEAVPGLLHVSLFLFFSGLGDFVLSINTTVGISTTILIGISGLLYIFTTFTPVICPQSPYQNSFSGIVWYLVRKSGGCLYEQRGYNEALNMAQGQLQLAMEESEGRKGRDVRAVRWLVGNMTEDMEMETFVMAIPGTFNTEWGIEVWKKVSNTIGEGGSLNVPIVRPITNTSIPAAIPYGIQSSHVRTPWDIFDPIIRLVRIHIADNSRTSTMALLSAPNLTSIHPHSATAAHSQEKDVVRELSTRIAAMLETYYNHHRFSGDGPWRKHARACIETTALFVCCLDAELHWFGDGIKLLAHLGDLEKPRMLASSGKDQLFVTCWTCLSLVFSHRTLQQTPSLVESDARSALELLEGTGEYDADDEQAPRCVPEIIETFDKALRCFGEITRALDLDEEEGLTDGQVKEILRNHESQISELEHINTNCHSFRNGKVDQDIAMVQDAIETFTLGIIPFHLPGLGVDNLDTDSDPVHFGQFVTLSLDFYIFNLIFPVQNLKRICSLAPILRDVIEERVDVKDIQATLQDLRSFAFQSELRGNLLHREVWRLQDLCDGGGLGFTVELFLIVLRKLLSTYPSRQSTSTLYVCTFRTITAGWRKYKHSLGTQKLLLDLVTSYRGVIADLHYPTYIVDEFLVFLGNILDAQTGPHIDHAMQELSHFSRLGHPRRAYFVKALGVITRARSPPS